MRHRDQNLSARESLCSFGTKTKLSDGRWYKEGVLHTKYGFARLYVQNGPRPSSSVSFIWKGRWYDRTWDREISERGMSIVAGRFVREIVGA